MEGAIDEVNMKSESPGRKTWLRFCKNRLALGSLFLIGLAVFMAVFCYLFLPDNTPDSNRMSLSLNNRPPGFSTTVLLFPKTIQPESKNVLKQFLLGTPDAFDRIPVSYYRIDGDYIYYQEFGIPGEDSGLEQRKHLIESTSGMSGTTLPEIDQGVYKFTDGKGESIQLAREKIVETFNTERVIRQTFWLGTDRYGRDMLSRLIAGTRVTFGVGLIAVVISLFLGLILGSVAGYFGGKVDAAVVWLINVIWSVPTLLLVISITLVLGKGFEQVFIAVGLTMWVDVARIVRSQFFSVRELEFVTAGRAMGFRSGRIIRRHLLPNIMGPVLVVAAANFSTAILLEAGLSFLGIGAQPPTPSWGAMIKENYGFIIIPGSAYLAILPGIAILLLTMAFTFVANGLRDAMDSRQQISLS